jgi:hypothetical protein
MIGFFEFRAVKVILFQTLNNKLDRTITIKQRNLAWCHLVLK